MNKLAIIFPGIGYTVERPLLYYAKKLASRHGFQTVDVPYTGFPQDVGGSPEKLAEAFDTALSQTERLLSSADPASCGCVLCISKSIGTAVSAAYSRRHGLAAKNLFFTPIARLFDFPVQEGLAFHGTADPWIKTSELAGLCTSRRLPLHVVEGANHSLETGDVLADIKNLQSVMQTVDSYITSLA